ncbi:MAG: hypothetical protein Q4G04_01770 [bacterium]|nr:hypothetical protein [bacterium]
MSDVIIKVYDILDELDNSLLINNIKEDKKILSANKEFMDMLNKYQSNNDINLKKVLLENTTYVNYLRNINQLNKYLYSINKRIKEIIGDLSCEL